MSRGAQAVLELDDETKLFRDMHHPHLVTCYGVATMNGIPTLVTELCNMSLEGVLHDDSFWRFDNLEKKFMTQDMIDDEKYTVLWHVALGLHQLHNKNVLHRDIKAGNILLDHHGKNWKICDFGEAKVLKHQELRFETAQPWRAGYNAGPSNCVLVSAAPTLNAIGQCPVALSWR